MDISIQYGEHGWFWRMKSGRMAAAITNHRLLNRHFPQPDGTYPPGAEFIVYMSESEFTTRRMARLLKVPRDRTRQRELAAYHDSKYSPDPISLPLWARPNREKPAKNDVPAPEGPPSPTNTTQQGKTE